MTIQGTTVMLTDKEREQVRAIAQAEGISEDEAASRMVSAAIARRVKRKTGKTPAKVHSIKKH